MTEENFKKNKFTVYFLVAIIFVAFFGVMMTKNNDNVNRGEFPDQIGEVDSDNANTDNEAVFCTMDAKICPDGSAVGRVAPDCEFSPCPGEEVETILGNPSLDGAIREYLLSQEEFVRNIEEEGVSFCHFQNLNENNQLFPYELVAVCSEFELNNGLRNVSYGIPFIIKIDYPSELSYYDISLMTHETPQGIMEGEVSDGKNFVADMERIFSQKAKENAENINVRALNLGLREQALEHFYTDMDWQNVMTAIMQCEVDSAWQAHSREVSVDLKDGTKLYAVEPKIDDIIDIAREASPECGNIRIGTE